MVFKFIAIISILLITGIAGYSYLTPYIYTDNTQVQYNSILDDPNLIIIEPTVQDNIITQSIETETVEDNYTSTWKNLAREKLNNTDRTIKYQEIRNNLEHSSKISISGTPECKPEYDVYPPITNPIVQGLNGTNGWYVSNIAVQFNSTDDCSGVKQVIVYQQGKATRTSSYHIINANDTISYSSYLDKTYPKGTIRIYYYGIDNSMNIEDKKSIDIHVDLQIPYLSLLNVADRVDIHEGNYNFTIYTADFHSGIDRVEIIPCKTTALRCTPIIYNMEMDDLISKEHVAYINYEQYYKKGIYSIEIRAYDYAGNYNIKKLSIYVDTDIKKILGLI